MTPNNIQTGYWVYTPERFVACYNTREEAQAHVDFQINIMKSKQEWFVDYIQIKATHLVDLKELSLPSDPDEDLTGIP